MTSVKQTLSERVKSRQRTHSTGVSVPQRGNSTQWYLSPPLSLPLAVPAAHWLHEIFTQRGKNNQRKTATSWWYRCNCRTDPEISVGYLSHFRLKTSYKRETSVDFKSGLYNDYLYISIYSFFFPTTLSPTPNANCRECSLGMCRYHKASKQNTVCTLLSPLPTLKSTLHTLFSLHFSVYSLQSMSAHTQLWSLLVLVRFLEMRTTLDALPQVDSAMERAGDGGKGL